MTRTWHNPERGPTPAELAAWADGALGEADADRVERWLADHPEALADALAQGEADRRLVALYRDHPPPDPSPAAWDAARRRIAARVAAPHRRRWPGFLLAVLAAAALLGGLAAAGLLLPVPKDRSAEGGVARLEPGDDNDEPFAVASASEVQIISMDARDADRVFVGQPLLDTLDFASSEDIELVDFRGDPEEDCWPKLQRGPSMPMVVVARADDEP